MTKIPRGDKQKWWKCDVKNWSLCDYHLINLYHLKRLPFIYQRPVIVKNCVRVMLKPHTKLLTASTPYCHRLYGSHLYLRVKPRTRASIQLPKSHAENKENIASLSDEKYAADEFQAYRVPSKIWFDLPYIFRSWNVSWKSWHWCNWQWMLAEIVPVNEGDGFNGN